VRTHPWTPPPGLCPWTPLVRSSPQAPRTRPLPRYGLALLAQEIGFVARQSDSALLRRTDELVIWGQGLGCGAGLRSPIFSRKSDFWAAGFNSAHATLRDRFGFVDRAAFLNGYFVDLRYAALCFVHPSRSQLDLGSAGPRGILGRTSAHLPDRLPRLFC
jgi:hypothetical protein